MTVILVGGFSIRNILWIKPFSFWTVMVGTTFLVTGLYSVASGTNVILNKDDFMVFVLATSPVSDWPHSRKDKRLTWISFIVHVCILEFFMNQSIRTLDKFAVSRIFRCKSKTVFFSFPLHGKPFNVINFRISTLLSGNVNSLKFLNKGGFKSKHNHKSYYEWNVYQIMFTCKFPKRAIIICRFVARDSLLSRGLRSILSSRIHLNLCSSLTEIHYNNRILLLKTGSTNKLNDFSWRKR